MSDRKEFQEEFYKYFSILNIKFKEPTTLTGFEGEFKRAWIICNKDDEAKLKATLENNMIVNPAEAQLIHFGIIIHSHDGDVPLLIWDKITKTTEEIIDLLEKIDKIPKITRD